MLYGENTWTINKANQGKNVVYITNSGIQQRQKSNSSYRYNPVLYLKSNVKIKTNDGAGSSTNPYNLEPGNN